MFWTNLNDLWYYLMLALAYLLFNTMEWSTQDLISIIAIFISFLALLCTSLQLFLQKRHNEQSLRPYGQIDLKDKRNTVYVYVKNYGLGPLIVKSIEYSKSGHSFDNIEYCLPGLDPTTYAHIVIGDKNSKALMPGQHLVLFELILTDTKTKDLQLRDLIRSELAEVQIIVHSRDIYNNKYVTERDLEWFRSLLGKKDLPERGLLST